MQTPTRSTPTSAEAEAPAPVPLGRGLEVLPLVLGLYAALVVGGGALLLGHFGAAPLQWLLALWVLATLVPVWSLARFWTRSKGPKAIAFEDGELFVPGRRNGVPAAFLKGIGVARSGRSAALVVLVLQDDGHATPQWFLARGADPAALEQFARSLAQLLGVSSAAAGPLTGERVVRLLSRTISPGQALGALAVVLLPVLVLSALWQEAEPRPAPIEIRGIAQDRLALRYLDPHLGLQGSAGVGFVGAGVEANVEAAVQSVASGLRWTAAPARERTILDRALRPQFAGLNLLVVADPPSAVRMERADGGAFRARSSPVEENRAALAWRVEAQLRLEQGGESAVYDWQYDLVGWRRGHGPYAGDLPPVTWAKSSSLSPADDGLWLLAVGEPRLDGGRVALASEKELGPRSSGPFSAQRVLVGDRPFFGRALASGGGRLAVAHRGGVAVYAELAGGPSLLRTIPAPDPEDDGFAQNLALGSDGRFLALSRGRAVELHDLDGDTPVRTLLGPLSNDRSGTGERPDLEPQVAFSGADLVVLWGAALGLEFFSLDPSPGGRFASSARTDLAFFGRVPGEPFGLGARLAADPASGRVAVLVSGAARPALGLGLPSRVLLLLVEPGRP